MLDLELGVLGSTERQPSDTLHRTRRNEPAAPIACQHEEIVEPSAIEVFGETVPALVPATRRDCDLPATARETAGCLHLDAVHGAVSSATRSQCRLLPIGMATCAPRDASQYIADISPKSPCSRGVSIR
jgi:hypothetical protein